MRKCERPEGMRKRCLFISLGKRVGKLIRADLNLTFPRSVPLCWASPRKWWVGSEAESVEGGSAGRAKVNLKMLELINRVSQAALSHPEGLPQPAVALDWQREGLNEGLIFPHLCHPKALWPLPSDFAICVIIYMKSPFLNSYSSLEIHWTLWTFQLLCVHTNDCTQSSSSSM